MTTDVRLRDVIEEDLPIFFEQQCEPEATRMAAFPPRERRGFMDHWTKIIADPMVFKQTILRNKEVAGHIVSWEHGGRRLVGYWIGKEYWGKGVATRALACFVQIVSSRPLYAYVAEENVGSIRVLEKCGFERCSQTAADAPASEVAVNEFVYRLERMS